MHFVYVYHVLLLYLFSCFDPKMLSTILNKLMFRPQISIFVCLIAFIYVHKANNSLC